MTKKQKLLREFLRFLEKQGVEMSKFRTDKEYGSAMFFVERKEQSQLVKQFTLTLKKP